MSSTQRSWLAALSLGILPVVGSGVSNHYELLLNNTGSQYALRMMSVGWLIAAAAGFLLAYFVIAPSPPRLPAAVLVLASLLATVPSWSWILGRPLNFDWLDWLPRTWLQYGHLEPLTVYLVFGFSVGWLWKATR